MTDYARPAGLDEAFKLLSGDGAAPMGGGTDLAGQVDRGIREPTLLVDLRDAGLGGIEEDDGGVRIGASVTLAELAASPLLEPYAVVATAASARRVAAAAERRHRRAATSASTRAAGTTAAASGTAGSAAATRATPSSASTASTAWSPATASPRIRPTSLLRSRRAARRSRSARAGGRGSCRCSTSTAARPQTTARSSSCGAASCVTAVRLPPPPDASAYERLGERAAFSFPLVSVAAARRGAETRLVAAGVANIPLAIDPADPLAGLKGSPQSAWKRRALSTLVERALARVA